jgi:hypothetical protein
MKNPNQQARIRKFWLEDFGPAMVMVASLVVLGTAVPPASAAPPEQHYTFTTVNAPDKDLAQYFQLTWINDSGLVIQQYIGKDGHSHTAALSGRKWTVLDVPGATDTGGTNPNSQGQVALSYSEDNMITWHLAIWQRGHYTYLPDPPPGYLSRGAQGINDRGLVSAGALDPLGNILGDLVDGGRHR